MTRRRWTVPFSALLLVGAVWTALWLARGGADGPGGPASTTVGAPPGPTYRDASWSPLDDAGSPASPEAASPSAAAAVGAASLPGFRADLLQLPDDTLLGFVEIPAGPFVMGSDPAVDSLAFDVERWSARQLQARVDLPRFFLARLETTIAQYAAFVAETGHPVGDPRALQAPPTFPVAFVSWPDALAYARWLDGALRDHPELPPGLRELLAAGYRVALPTEAQWEKGARGPDGRIYPWGDAPDPTRANFRRRGPAPVGTFDCRDCPYGLLDMAGNVWEWTRSPYQPYPFDETDDEETVDADALWVIRGGSFGDPEAFVRGANRGAADPGARRPFIGFRVALTR